MNSMFNLVSYAQNFEDIILWRALCNVPNGRYIDLGAQSPDEHSVSRLFYLKGWRGLHVEPTQHYAGLLRNARPDEQVVQAAVTDEPGELWFFDIAETGLSTLKPEIADQHRQAGFSVSEVRVPAVTLDDIFDYAGPGEIHWLKIDVEGAEYQVIAGWKSARRPWVLVIESTRPLSSEPSHHQWEPLVLDKGYVFAYFDGLNRFYVSVEHSELLQALSFGPNVFDDFVLAPQSSFCAAANAVAAEERVRGRAELTLLSDELQQLRLEAEARSAMDASLLQQLRAEAEAQRAVEVSLRHDVEILHEAVEAYKEDFERALSLGQNAAVEIARRDEELARQQALMQQLLNSKSWRVTRPLRWAMGCAILLVRQPKMLVREGVVGAMRVVFARPRLGRLANRVLRLVPRLHGRLRLLASHHGIVAAPVEAVLVGGLGQVQLFGDGDGDGDAKLSLRGRQINARLRASMKCEEF